jgi:16S rRNA (cytosine1402-N4)-methyltransferase
MTAEKWLKSEKNETIKSALEEYWDFSPKTAEYLTKLFDERRKKSPFKTTFELKDFLWEHHFNQKKIAVIFQVIRIMVNKELDQLKIFLSDFPNTLKKGWRCLIITYHSVEDRITKNTLKELAEKGEFKLINKKVIVPHYTEVQKNKAARSAKLRIIEKL